VETTEHLAELRRQGQLLGAAAERSDLDTPIPTCPGWAMRDLLRHVGDVQRWAAAHVAEGRMRPIREVERVAGPLPEDRDLLAWFREGHQGLVRTLSEADPDVACWTFLPAPSPLAFWTRRQSHETSIHRADAESPGGVLTAFDPRFAADGIDELLFGFLGRPSEEPAPADPIRTLHLCASDTEGEWFVPLHPSATPTPEHAEADCTVRANASDLYLLAWNRRAVEGLEVAGDSSVMDLWRDDVQITWSRERERP
jgi:uncharacterized protein (TIGR03083 family)